MIYVRLSGTALGPVVGSLVRLADKVLIPIDGSLFVFCQGAAAEQRDRARCLRESIEAYRRDYRSLSTALYKAVGDDGERVDARVRVLWGTMAVYGHALGGGDGGAWTAMEPRDARGGSARTPFPTLLATASARRILSARREQ